MLQEMKLEDALKKFLQGKKVLVAPARAMDPGKERYLFRSLESVLNGKRFLVEVAPMEINKNMTQEPRGYTGFLHIRCEHCGKTKTFCTKHQLSYYGCKECGKKTDLKNLKLAFINCECGGTTKYFTNETAELIELNCINCGMPVALKYNAKKKLYETIRS